MTEIINIGVGRAAGVLNEMVGSHVSLKVPNLQALYTAELDGYLNDFSHEILSSVSMPFYGSLEGMAALTFPQRSAAQLVSLLTGEELSSPDLGSLKIETLNEVGNIVINAIMGSIANITDKTIRYRVPTFTEKRLRSLLTPSVLKGGAIIIAQTKFTVAEHDITGNVFIVFEVNSFRALLATLDTL